jgi:ribonuclease HII
VTPPPSSWPTLEVERELVERGFGAVIALDEVGRGALAGPVSVGAVVWTPEQGEAPHGVRDSKLVAESKRTELAQSVQAWSVCAVGHAEPGEIDGEGIVGALALAAVRAIRQVWAVAGFSTPPVVLLDGSHDWLSRRAKAPVSVVVRPKADRDCQSVAAASLIAKSERDQMMRELAQDFPQFGFDRHKGYGSPAHLQAIRDHGMTPLHRRSFVHRERFEESTD